jgi:hypothetical protein
VRITPEFSSAQIVLLGRFAPGHFTPEWLTENGLVGSGESRAAEIKATGEWVADVSIDWCRLFCTAEKFALISQQAPWVRLSDFCVKLFTEIEPETSLSYMGINRTVHFNAGSLSAKDDLGRRLAPRNMWGGWGEILEKDEGKGASGLTTLTLRQGHGLNDRLSGHIEARIGPGEGNTVIMHINDHYEAKGKEEQSGTGDLMRRLAHNFENSIKRSDWIVDELMKQVKR